MTDPLHVTSETGWITATSTTIGTLLTGGGFFTLLAVWLKQKNPRRLIEVEAEQHMREELHVQNEKLNTRITALETQLEKQQRVNASEREIFMHQIKGLEQIIFATFEVLRVAAPTSVPGVMDRMMDAFEKHKERVAKENATLMALREGHTLDPP